MSQPTSLTAPRPELSSELVCQAYLFRKDFPALAHLAGSPHLTEGNVVWAYHVLMELTGKSEDECYSACEQAADDDLLDWGTSLRSGWVDSKGYALLDTKGEDLSTLMDTLFDNNVPFDRIAAWSDEMKMTLLQELDRLENGPVASTPSSAVPLDELEDVEHIGSLMPVSETKISTGAFDSASDSSSPTRGPTPS